MKIQTVLLSLGLVSTAFCLDEYQPVQANNLEVDLNYSPTFVTGGYNSGGTKVSAQGSPMLNDVGLQLKYGIIPGLDIEASGDFADYNEDLGKMQGFNGSLSGFTPPDVAVKYALTDLGVGVFLDLTLPVATGDFNQSPSPYSWALAPGLIYGKNFGDFQAIALAAYLINFKNSDNYTPQNDLVIYLKPGYSISDMLSAHLGLRYEMFNDSKFETFTNDDSGYLFSLQPGVNFTQSKMLAYELNVPFTVAGKNQLSAWGIEANLYVTLPL